MESESKPKSKIYTFLIITAVAITFVGFLVDLQSTIEYGGIDLRNRVVGARVLLEGMDPYFFQWNSTMSDRLLDPNSAPDAVVSRVTVTPPVLVLHIFMAGLPYITQRIIWLLLQWIAFLSITFIFVKKSGSRQKRKIILVLCWFTINSYFWRLHIEIGQVYIFYIALLSLAWFFAQSSFKHNELLSGFLVGFTASLRLPMLILLVPFLIYRKGRLFLGSLLGFIFGLLLPLTITKFSIWQSYFTAMLTLANIKFAEIVSGPNEGSMNSYPRIIEGMNNLALSSDISRTHSSFLKILSRLEVNNGLFLTIGFLIITLLISVFALRLSHKRIPINLVFLLGIVMYLTSELFLPVQRYSYNDVQWIFPVALIVMETDVKTLFSNHLIILLAVSLLFSIGCFSWMPKFLLISIFLMFLYVTLMLLTLLWQHSQLRFKLPIS